MKPVEFLWIPPTGGKLVLVEAKSSFSNPSNAKDFNKNLQEIYTKLVDSLTVLIATKLGRHPNIGQELPAQFQQISWSDVTIHLRLVIPGFEKSWLPPITDALRVRLKHFLAAFGVSDMHFQVLNKELALKQRLLKE
ncbi:hypothetical protein [Pseudoalteromonas sp. OOF1S-7]|uniref:hypothetical protein n=1 Tax=Pseudoalteromonas sp. OOF1S-7 TaxID=2917757 RepID=UPI001EF69D8C|nr:hypothetical protein [Pseudoalteromonas sp. OOF1S-7]MCG7534360.1 hypothetical protein [Pseudoalteromonas sp. OOF1S-7]